MSTVKPATSADGLDWADIAPSFLRYAASGYKNRHLIHKLWMQLRLSIEQGTGLDSPATNIAIFGRSNVGKSVLRDALRGETRSLSYQLPGISNDAERHLVTVDSWSRIVTVAPGQSGKERDEWIQKSLHGNSTLNGVIYVSDWGFSMPRTPDAVRPLIDSGIDTVDKLRQHMVALELADFIEICKEVRKSIASGFGPSWMIVVSTKADLYPEDLDAAQSFYRVAVADGEPELTNDFGRAAKEHLVDAVGQHNIKLASAPVCSFAEDFQWADQNVQSRLPDGHKRALLTHLVTLMDDLT